MSVWRPESFSDFHSRLKSDPEGASNALDLSMQTVAKQSQNAVEGVAALQPAGGITKNRPTDVPLYYPWWDSSLNLLIIFQGRGVWRDTQGNIV